MSAVPSAVPSAFSAGGQLTSEPLPAPMGEVATEYPGVLAGQHGDPFFGNHAITSEQDADAQATDGPAGDPPPNPFESSAQVSVPSGGAFPTGVHYANHGTPAAPWDSNAGIPFAGGPGAAGGLSDDLHAFGRGASLKFFEQPPDIGSPYIDRIPNESFAPQVEYDPADGKQVSASAAGNFDGYTAHDQVYANPMSDVTPRFTPYLVRPVYPNLAATGQPLTSEASAYGVPGGQLTDMANHQPDQSVIAESPPDPTVTTSPVPGASPHIGAEWVAG
jgi:hypothetical protein